MTLQVDTSIPRLPPLHPLDPDQCVGYLEHVESLKCIKAFDGFAAGSDYPILASRTTSQRKDTKINLDGNVEEIERIGLELAIKIVDDNGNVSGFVDDEKIGIIGSGQFRGFSDLVTHFQMPEIKDIAKLHPNEYQANVDLLESLESWMKGIDSKFAFTPYQMDDLARAAIRDGLILGWETGLGKTIGAFTYSLLKVGWIEDGLSLRPRAPVLLVAIGDLHEQLCAEAKARFGITVRRANRNTTKIENEFYIASYEEISRHQPFLNLCRERFKCVLVDEGTKIKGEYTKVSIGVRSLDPAYRLVATATPIKNRLSDAFSILHWVAGGKKVPHIGFPYADSHAGRRQFADKFQVVEKNVTKETKRWLEGKSQKCEKPTAEACNLQRLWAITTPLILRRLKTEAGKDMVKKIVHHIKVPLGESQFKAYRKVIKKKFIDKTGKQTIGVKLQILRQLSACPHRQELGEYRSKFEYTPKVAAVLSLIDTILNRKEQVLVFSAFTEITDTISRRLLEARVPHVVCDGRMSQKKRAESAMRFKMGRPGIMLAGQASMAYGHSFSRVNNIISTSKDWALDLWEQEIGRSWRLDSVKDLNLYSIVSVGTVEEAVERLIDEKSNSASMVLDGVSMKPRSENEDLNRLLSEAVHDFESIDGKDHVDERKLEAEWPMLVEQLRNQGVKNG
jgi:SNF2 family DNA or RNA helicase